MARHRAGFTLIETLVVVAIIGILAGLTLMAVQSARESARRVRCAANLRQIGLAMLHYQAATGVFPTAMAEADDRTQDGPGPWPRLFYYSPFVRILPALEQRPLFDSINLQLPQAAISPENATAAAATIDVFLCPSDGAAAPGGTGPMNYRACTGAGYYPFGAPGRPGEAGLFEAERWVRPAEVRDGLSTTAMVSEKLLGGGDPGGWDRRRDFWYAGIQNDPTNPLPTAAVVAACGAGPPRPAFFSKAGATWFIDGFENTYYNHAMPPNASTPDCSTFDAFDGPGKGAGSGAFAARSFHGGVNFVAADGSVHRAGDGIDPTVWRALSTRAGGDVVGAY